MYTLLVSSSFLTRNLQVNWVYQALVVVVLHLTVILVVNVPLVAGYYYYTLLLCRYFLIISGGWWLCYIYRYSGFLCLLGVLATKVLFYFTGDIIILVFNVLCTHLLLTEGNNLGLSNQVGTFGISHEFTHRRHYNVPAQLEYTHLNIIKIEIANMLRMIFQETSIKCPCN